ncbi:putative trafficking protein particle complex subunit [Helianthus annuus]|uniref:Trafficking protein particle complex subunit n=1 Tax=Helianthus annuus TaxID=4232 RepID=A0A251SPM8_HELAN|nr:putative trafficking protein particle complex subunit [Helianthus annuus]KAJ0496727.1 putative trafficking protein particle complex subunit [Helianthus annuus]KAJ0670284.1 putative trafficking protein particle complex subunit [Helianthus annuus]
MQFFGGSEISPSPPVPTASGNNAHMMYIFNRNGVCLLYREWNRPLRTLNSNQDHKLMFGLLFSLKSLTAKMDPSSAEKGNLGVPQLPGQGCSFHSFRTNTYKLSFMESPSGIKIILVTHPKASDLRDSLKYIYNLYVEYVVKNPLYTPGTPIRSELFNTTLDQYVRGERNIWYTRVDMLLISKPASEILLLCDASFELFSPKGYRVASFICLILDKCIHA